MTVKERLCGVLQCCPKPKPTKAVLFRLASQKHPQQPTPQQGEFITHDSPEGLFQMYKLSASEHGVLAVQGRDEDENPTVIEFVGAPSWTAVDPTIVELTPNADGTCVVEGDKVGTTLVQMTGVIKQGTGEQSIAASLEVEVIPGNTVKVVIVGSAPEPNV